MTEAGFFCAMAKHVRHKPPTELPEPRKLILACPQFRSSVNLSRIVRLAGCAGIPKIVASGQTKIDSKIARDAIQWVQVERRRTLTNWLKNIKSESYRLVALEQADQSDCLYDYKFNEQSVLVIGHERHGVSDQDLQLVDDVIEIPVFGQPFSYNVVAATTMAVYEYCRQFPGYVREPD